MLPSNFVDGILPLTLRTRYARDCANHDDDSRQGVEESPFLKRRYDQVPIDDEDAHHESDDGTSSLFLVTTYAKQVRRIVEQTLLYRRTQRSSYKKESESGRNSLT